MAVLRVDPLPEGALEAAELFHREILPKAMELLPDPPRDGEGDHPQGGGGGPRPQASLRQDEDPLRQRSALPPPRPGEDIVIIFPPAPHDHRGWRLAVLQGLAREAAPVRVNGIAGDDEGAIAEALAFLEAAPGVTGQLLAVDPG